MGSTDLSKTVPGGPDVFALAEQPSRVVGTTRAADGYINMSIGVDGEADGEEINLI